MPVSKSDNMLAILWLLKSGRKLTAMQLAESLEIHVRTVYRCIDSLCASGVPIVAEPGHGGGYSLLPSFTDAPLTFDLDEQKALVHAATFATEAGYPLSAELNRAMSKLMMYSNDERAAAIHGLEGGLDVIHPPTDARMSEVLRTIERAISQACPATIEYRSASGGGEAASRVIHPYGLVHWKSKWYIVGYCAVRGEIRSFRADRIEQVFPMEEDRFDKPVGFSARNFLLDGLLRADAEETMTICIAGSSRALDELCGHWLFAHALIERVGEEAVFRMAEEAALRYAPYFLLGYGKAVKVKAPESMKERMRDVLRDMIDVYP